MISPEKEQLKRLNGELNNDIIRNSRVSSKRTRRKRGPAMNMNDNRNDRSGKNFLFTAFIVFDIVALIIIALIFTGVFSPKEEEPEIVQLKFEQQYFSQEPGFYVALDGIFQADILRLNQERFANSVFLGDSLTEGLSLYGYVDASNVVAVRGLNLITAQKKIKKIAKKNPQYLFVMLGINDLSWTGSTVSGVADSYKKLIEKIHKKTPETKIYIQSLLPVTKKYESSHKLLKN